MHDHITHRRRIATWLREQGHEVAVERHDARYATVTFRLHRADFIVRTDENDPDFLFLTHAFQLPDELQNRPRAHRIAHHIERGLKVVKVALDWDRRRIEFNAEQFVADGEFAPIFWRCVGVIEEAARRFFEEARRFSSSAAAQRFIDEVSRDLGESRQ